MPTDSPASPQSPVEPWPTEEEEAEAAALAEDRLIELLWGRDEP